MSEQKSNSGSNKCAEDLEGCSGNSSTCTLDPAECAQRHTDSRGGQSMDECLGRSLDQLSTAFTASARRWELIVYPSLFAFILLAGYGFYLIFNLTSDVSRVAKHMDAITQNMQDISTNMNSISKNMVLMTQSVDAEAQLMSEMVVSMRNMNVTMGMMRHDISVINNSVSRPMQFMNTFMPW